MDNSKFEEIKRQFINSDIDGKINIYMETPDLTGEQYKELLKLYPYDKIEKLENAFQYL